MENSKIFNRIIYAIDDIQLSVDDIITQCLTFKKYLYAIKFHILYHSLGISNLIHISNRTGIPLFLDLKLYDTPETVIHTIYTFPDEVKFLTITSANNNVSSITAAASAARVKNIQLFVVGKLTSADQYDLRAFYDIIKIVNDNKLGLVCSGQLLSIAKAYDIPTITPGVALPFFLKHNSYNDQKQKSTDLIDLINQGTYPVLGRSMPTNPKQFEELIVYA